MLLSSLSLFFPAFNEEQNISELIKRWHPVMKEVAEKFEMLIIDDGSSDATAQVTLEVQKSYPEVRLVQHQVNQGYGGAVKTGLRESRMDYVFFTDADLQFEPGDLKKLTGLIDQADMVTGYRVGRQDNIIRRFNGWAWGALTRLMLPIRVRDIDCAFKLFRRSALESIDLSALKSDGAMISAEILARLTNADQKILEIPVSHLPRVAGDSSGGNILVILRAFGELWRFRQLLRK